MSIIEISTCVGVGGLFISALSYSISDAWAKGGMLVGPEGTGTPSFRSKDRGCEGGPSAPRELEGSDGYLHLPSHR